MPKEQLFASLVLLTVLAESLGASQKLLSCQGEDGLPVPWYAFTIRCLPSKTNPSTIQEHLLPLPDC